MRFPKMIYKKGVGTPLCKNKYVGYAIVTNQEELEIFCDSGWSKSLEECISKKSSDEDVKKEVKKKTRRKKTEG